MAETDPIEKLYVFGRDSRADGTNYPRMALVPEGLFDPAQRMKFREQGVIQLIPRDELPADLGDLPQPVQPQDQVARAVPVVAIEIQAELVRSRRALLGEAVAEMERLTKGGIPNRDDGAVRGNVTPEDGGIAYDPTLEDAPSPLDADPADAAAPAPELGAGASRAATAAYTPEDNDREGTAVGAPAEQESQELPAYLRRN